MTCDSKSDFLDQLIKTYIWVHEMDRADFGVVFRILRSKDLLSEAQYLSAWEMLDQLLPEKVSEPDEEEPEDQEEPSE